MATDGVGNNPVQFNGSKIDYGNKKATGENLQTGDKEISIFSSYDTNKDATVNFSEAKNTGLFGQAALTSEVANTVKNDCASDLSGNASFLSRVENIAKNTFAGRMKGVFEGLLPQKFQDITNLKKVYNQGTNDSTQEKGRNELNSTVRTAIQKAREQALNELGTEYKKDFYEAIKTANADAKNGNLDAEERNELNNKLGDKNYDATKQKDADDKSVNKDRVITQDVFSTYDKDKDELVKGKNELPISQLNINNYVDKNMQGKIADEAKKDLQQLYDIKVGQFEINSGKETITGKDDKEVNKAVIKAAKQMDTYVKNEVKSFAKELDSDLKNEFNKVVDAAASSGGLENRQRPISTMDGRNLITIVNGNATYAGGTNTRFTPDEKGGGDLFTTITKKENVENSEQDVKYNLSMHINKEGEITNRTEVKAEANISQDTLLALGRQVSSKAGNDKAIDVTLNNDDTIQTGSDNNQIAEGFVTSMIDSLFNAFTKDGNVQNDLDDDSYDASKDSNIDKQKFNDYKALGFSALAARVFAQSDSGISLVSYDKSNGKLNNIQVTKSYQDNNNSKTVTVKFNNVEDLNKWIKKAYDDKKNTAKA